MTETPAEGATCKPNISAAGRRFRRRLGFTMIAIVVAMGGAFVVAHVSWYWRLSVFAPAAIAAFGYLQASRNTCVKHAREGTREADDSMRAVQVGDDVELRASRRVAAAIQRDAMLFAAAAAALAALSSLVA